MGAFWNKHIYVGLVSNYPASRVSSKWHAEERKLFRNFVLSHLSMQGGCWETHWFPVSQMFSRIVHLLSQILHSITSHQSTRYFWKITLPFNHCTRWDSLTTTPTMRSSRSFMVVKCLERVCWLVNKISCSLFTPWTLSSFATSTPSFSQEEIWLLVTAWSWSITIRRWFRGCRLRCFSIGIVKRNIRDFLSPVGRETNMTCLDLIPDLSFPCCWMDLAPFSQKSKCFKDFGWI